MMAPSILGYMLRNGMETSGNLETALKHFANTRRFYEALIRGNLQGIHHRMESANWTRLTLLYLRGKQGEKTNRPAKVLA